MSRIAFLILVLANLGWYAWIKFLAPSEPAPTSRSAADIAPTLTLAREVEGNELPAPLTLAAARDEQPAAIPDELAVEPIATGSTYQRCVSLGPFEGLPAATKAMVALTEVGYSPNQRIAEGEVWAGYQVSITGYKTKPEANEALSDLGGLGVTDAYVIPGTDPPHTIALGVFSTRPRSLIRAREIRDMGFDPAVTERTRPGSVYWLDIVLDDSGFINPADFESERGRILSLQIQACPVVADSG